MVGFWSGIPFSISDAFNETRTLASRISTGLMYPAGTRSIESAIRNEMARSSFGSRARARAGGRWLDCPLFGEAVILRAPSSSGGVLVRADVAPAALRNGSGGENERVACGNTVLLSRSLAGFFATRTGEHVGFCSATSGAQRDVSFLKRLRNGIVIAFNGPPPLLATLLQARSRLRALSQFRPRAKFSSLRS